MFDMPVEADEESRGGSGKPTRVCAAASLGLPVEKWWRWTPCGRRHSGQLPVGVGHSLSSIPSIKAR